MRIDAYSAINQIYSTSKAKQAYKQVGVSNSDKFEISQMGKDLGVARAAVAAVPDVREDKIADIKSRMDAGTYNVSDSSFADLLISKYMG